MSNHYRKTIVKYKERQKSQGGCPFCRPETLDRAVFVNKHLYIVPNLTPYDLWELHDVEEHLLVVPKRHIEKLSELGKTEKAALMDVYAEYEAKGYSVYARGVGFVKRSVAHQHTHFIKNNNRKPRISLFLSGPYFLFKR